MNILDTMCVDMHFTLQPGVFVPLCLFLFLSRMIFYGNVKNVQISYNLWNSLLVAVQMLHED